MHLTWKKLLLQAMLWAIGVGAKGTLPAAAALNWVIKDGLVALANSYMPLAVAKLATPT